MKEEIQKMLDETLEVGKRLGRVEEKKRILDGISNVVGKWPAGVWFTIRNLFD